MCLFLSYSNNVHRIRPKTQTHRKTRLSIAILIVSLVLTTLLFLGSWVYGSPFEILNSLSALNSQHSTVNLPSEMPYYAKPVIYLYPTTPQTVEVQITYQPGFAITYPEYNQKWIVTAFPDGHLINRADGKEYSYLYWEGNPDPEAFYDLSKGFVVPGDQTRYFLEEKLSYLGLIPKEYNEFIVYWLPKMEKNQYNLIHFASKAEYEDRTVLSIEPQPDSILRIFMVYKPLQKPIVVKPQKLNSFERRGFSVIEWGGSQL